MNQRQQGVRCLLIVCILVLFCGCSEEPKLVTDSLQETENETKIKLQIEATQETEEIINIENVEALQQKETVEESCFVYVCGAVKNPGVYELQVESRLYEAVEAAGGFREDASETCINLAQKVCDGQQIVILTKDEALQTQTTQIAQTPQQTQEESQNGGKININTADVSMLTTLTGIGESKAKQIISYRESNGSFSSIEEITNVSGIGIQTFEKIREQITVG